MKRVLAFWWLLPVLGIGAALWIFLRPQQAQSAAQMVSVVPVQQSEFRQTVRVTGSIEAQVYNVAFARTGRVTAVLVREGQQVKKGDILARLETDEENSKIALAEDALFALAQRRQNTELEAQIARQKLERQVRDLTRRAGLQQELFDLGAIAKNDLLETQNQLLEVRGQLETNAAQRKNTISELENQRTSRQSEVRALRQAQSRTVLRSPVVGRVLRVDYQAGLDTSANTSRDNAASIRILEDGTLRARVRLPEAEALQIRAGQPAEVRLDAKGNAPIAAKVQSISAQADVAGAGGSATLPVILKLLGATNALKTGLTISAEITTLRLRDALQIPLEALPDETSVWILEPNKTVKRQNIEIIARNATVAVVRGIAATSQVVLLPPPELQDGSSVQVMGGL